MKQNKIKKVKKLSPKKIADALGADTTIEVGEIGCMWGINFFISDKITKEKEKLTWNNGL